MNKPYRQSWTTTERGAIVDKMVELAREIANTRQNKSVAKLAVQAQIALFPEEAPRPYGVNYPVPRNMVLDMVEGLRLDGYEYNRGYITTVKPSTAQPQPTLPAEIFVDPKGLAQPLVERSEKLEIDEADEDAVATRTFFQSLKSFGSTAGMLRRWIGRTPQVEEQIEELRHHASVEWLFPDINTKPEKEEVLVEVPTHMPIAEQMDNVFSLLFGRNALQVADDIRAAMGGVDTHAVAKPSAVAAVRPPVEIIRDTMTRPSLVLEAPSMKAGYVPSTPKAGRKLTIAVVGGMEKRWRRWKTRNSHGFAGHTVTLCNISDGGVVKCGSRPDIIVRLNQCSHKATEAMTAQYGELPAMKLRRNGAVELVRTPDQLERWISLFSKTNGELKEVMC